MTLPKAREERSWRMDATTTVSYINQPRSVPSPLHDRTSSHSAPAVSKATNVCETPSRRATIAVWSMKRSAPHSSRNSAAVNAPVSEQTLSQLMTVVFCVLFIVGVSTLGNETLRTNMHQIFAPGTKEIMSYYYLD